jgi:hypothetical protein
MLRFCRLQLLVQVFTFIYNTEGRLNNTAHANTANQSTTFTHQLFLIAPNGGEVGGPSCSLQKTSPDTWKVEVFSPTHKIIHINEKLAPVQLNQILTTEFQNSLHLVNKKGGLYEVYLMCSSARVFIVVNFLGSSVSSGFCADISSTLKSIKIFSNNEAQRGVACLGERPLKLLLGPRHLNEIPKLLRQLQTSDAGQAVVDNKQKDPFLVSSSTVLVQLKETYRFRERDAKAKIEDDPILHDLLEYIDYDRRFDIAGESFPLFTAFYPGF